MKSRIFNDSRGVEGGHRALASTILISVVSSLLTGILSTLLTIYLTPRARHSFWSRERITELRLATYDKVNGITAAIYMHDVADDQFSSDVRVGVRVHLSPMEELLASLMTAHDEVQNRFSETALHAYEKLEVLVESSGLPLDKQASYSIARDAVLRQLHTESLAF
jgi:hypothetical protein